MKRFFSKGFTLAELLIALAILGVIATFTIPKVLNSSNDSQSKAVAKEVAGMLSGAYQAYQLDSTVGTTTAISSLTPYMNYVKTIVTTDSLTGPMFGGSASIACDNGSAACLLLHSGAIIGYFTGQTFGATSNYLVFMIDPDGNKSALNSSSFVLYYNGRLTTGQNATSGSAGGTGYTLDATDESYMNF